MDDLFEQILTHVVQLMSSGQQVPDDIANFLIQELTSRLEEPDTIPQGAELLWMLANGNEDAFRQYITNFPDPSLEALRRNPQRLQRVIDDLGRQVPPQEETAPDGFPQGDFQSSNVFGSLYNPKTKKLFVKFQGSGDVGQGSVYAYDNIPPSIARLFQMGQGVAKTTGENKWGSWWKGKIPSLGAALNTFVKQGGYSYQKVS